jgi:DNA-binding Xre family transcriptional regulator
MAYEISEIKSEVLFSINMTTRVSLILLQILKKICAILLRYNCYHKGSN